MIEKYVENFRYAFIYENYLALTSQIMKIDLKDLYLLNDLSNNIKRDPWTRTFRYTDFQYAFIKQSLSQYERQHFELIKKFYFGYLVKLK